MYSGISTEKYKILCNITCTSLATILCYFDLFTSQPFDLYLFYTPNAALMPLNTSASPNAACPAGFS